LLLVVFFHQTSRLRLCVDVHRASRDRKAATTIQYNNLLVPVSHGVIHARLISPTHQRCCDFQLFASMVKPCQCSAFWLLSPALANSNSSSSLSGAFVALMLFPSMPTFANNIKHASLRVRYQMSRSEYYMQLSLPEADPSTPYF
jgi:hypothetical protein